MCVPHEQRLDQVGYRTVAVATAASCGVPRPPPHRLAWIIVERVNHRETPDLTYRLAPITSARQANLQIHDYRKLEPMRLNMRTLLPATLALAAGMMICAPVAAADPAGFLEELTINNVWLPGKNADEVIDAGYATCADLRNGVSVLDAMSNVESLYQFDQGTLFVSASSTHLCPDFAG
jgi:hypothetical protein